MSSSVSLDVVTSPPVRPEETLQIALLLAAGSAVEDVVVRVHAAAGEWKEAFHFVPPMLAFAVGIVFAFPLHRMAEGRAYEISTLIKIVLLIIIAILHNRLPDVAGTLRRAFARPVWP